MPTTPCVEVTLRGACAVGGTTTAPVPALVADASGETELVSVMRTVNLHPLCEDRTARCAELVFEIADPLQNHW